MSHSLTLIESQLHEQWLRAQNGETSIYTQVLTTLSQLLRAFMRKRMQTHPNDIEDLVQETLMAIHQKRHTYDSQPNVTATPCMALACRCWPWRAWAHTTCCKPTRQIAWLC